MTDRPPLAPFDHQSALAKVQAARPPKGIGYPSSPPFRSGRPLDERVIFAAGDTHHDVEQAVNAARERLGVVSGDHPLTWRTCSRMVVRPPPLSIAAPCNSPSWTGMMAT